MARAERLTAVSDEALAESARSGDRTAYTELVERYRDVAVAYAYARLRRREDAEDIAQEAFVRAYLSLGRFDTSGRWGAWLMSILRNLCTDAHRRAAVRAADPIDPSFTDGRPTPEAQTVDLEGRRELGRAVMDLPEKFRVPVVMHYVGGRTYREIAVALGLPESTIIGRMAGGLRLLRRKMAAEGSR